MSREAPRIACPETPSWGQKLGVHLWEPILETFCFGLTGDLDQEA